MNFILVILDSLRQDHVGAYGNDWIKTPNLDRFAAESVRFTNAYPESVPTLPFRTSTLTGRRVYPFKRWVPHNASYPYQDIYGTDKNLNIPGWSPIAKDDTTLAEFFHEHDFTSALVTDCLHQMYPGMNYHRGYHAWHWVRGQEWDMMRLHSLLRKNPEVAEYFTDKTDLNHPKVWEVLRNMVNTADRMYEEKYFAPQVFAQAERWLEEYYQDLNENLFMCVDCFDPHEPWDTPEYYRKLYADPEFEGTKVFMPIYTPDYKSYMSDEELRYMRACYASEVTMVDRWFGQFMDKIRLMGLDKNSVICVVSDHGHQLGENGYTGKMPSGLLPCLMDLVLMIRHPEGVAAGEACDAVVQNHDILPTICDIMGFDTPEYAEGTSFWPVIQGKQDKIRDYATSIFKEFVWVHTDEFCLIRKTDLSRAILFDVKSDPMCTKDISEGNQSRIDELWQLALNDAGGDIPIIECSFNLVDEKS
jgi:arylsulfatase A-like enzyme